MGRTTVLPTLGTKGRHAISSSSMVPFGRSLAAGVLSLGLILSGCAGQPAPTEGTGTSTPEAPAVSLQQPGALRGVFDGGAGPASLAASSAFYASSPAAVVLGPGAPAAAGQASAAAVGLGVPLLVVEPGNEQQVAGELERLGAEAVVLYGAPAAGWAAVAGDRVQVPGPADADGFQSLLSLDAVPAEAAPLVAAVAAMERDAELSVPGLEAAAPKETAASAAASADQQDNAPVQQLPEYKPAGAGTDAMVLATEDPASAAAVATARAAGAEVRMVETADPRADPAVIEDLRSRRDGGIYAAGNAFGGGENFAAHTDVALNAPELPGGGQTVFPGRRMVALYGHPSGGSLGVLGEQGMGETITRAGETAAQYQPYSSEPVVPALEIITTVASSGPGADGDYSEETAAEDLLPWIEAAGEAGIYVVLDLQPGYSTFLNQALRYEELLKYPHVGLALDAEWRLAPGQRHLEQIGSVDAAEINEVSAWLADLTQENVLPQKLFMLHQFNLSMIRNRDQLNVSHSELAVSLHADGHGTPGQKLDTWNALRDGLQPEIWPGWKNFYDEDTPTLTPEQTFTQIEPMPWFISYQ
ncbi:hypothetical protein QMA10_00730 [Arthrobacter sp. APC 3897]|uniref:hypothetical protein n=1 Tax=Arthrobacter sp. APC 3897 TaxID=3035204 RepID=UPI0025B29941|nr:hypothetical protein [Arthrobacter sp. APC 3897]MDN3480452.1 hypothetical protein [Arthrobacter sp. APC 3897]